MFSRKTLTLLFAALFILSYCKKNDGIFDPTLLNPVYQGITFTDEFGNVIQEDKSDWQLSYNSNPTLLNSVYQGTTFTDESGNVIQEDKNDWQLRHNFNPNFIIQSVDTNISAVPLDFKVYPAYPNPIENNVSSTVEFALPQFTSVEIMLYDQNNNVWVILDEIFPAGRYSVFITNVSANGIYRCKYRLGDYYGYGDIWFK